MFDSGYNMDIYQSAKIKIGAVMINPEMLKFTPYHLQTKNMRQHAVKKLPYLLKYVPDQ